MIIKNRCVYCLIAILYLLCSGWALAKGNTAVTIAGGIVHLRGLVTESACAVSPESADKQVVMGQVTSSRFTDLGSWADPVPFTLQLTDCDTSVSQQLGVVFSGVTDGKDPHVFSVGNGSAAAQGVGLGIFDGHGELMIPNTNPRNLIPLENGVVTLPFTAKYRATSHQVTPGDASAQVWFFLYYP